MRPLFRRCLAALTLVLLLASSSGAAPPPATTATAPALAGPVHDDGPLGAHPARAQDDIRLEVVGVQSTFGPETYKRNDFANTRNPSDLENQSTNWDTALGHSITFQVRVSPDEQPLACDERFLPDAFITTSFGRLYGWTNGTIDTTPPGGAGNVCQTGPPGVRLFNITFDLDGAPDPVNNATTFFPALLNGFYIATLNLYYQVAPSPTNPTGQGTLAGSLDIGFRVGNPLLQHSDGLWRFPESTLRMLSDVGAADGLLKDHYLMPPAVLAPGDERHVNITFDAADVGTPFERTDWYATRVATSPDLPTSPVPGTPLDPLLDKTEAQTERFPAVIVQAQPYILQNNTVPPSRAVQMPLHGSEFPSRQTPIGGQDVTGVGPVFWPLFVVSIVIHADLTTFLTGAATYVQPVADRSFPIRGLDVLGASDPLGATGTTRVTMRDAGAETGGATGADAGDLFVLRSSGGPTAHDFLTETPVSRIPGETWATAEINHALFPDDISAYSMLALLYGDHDAFLGMTLARRGIDVSAASLRLVEGKTGSLLVTVTNLANDYDNTPGESDYAVDVRLTLEGLPGGGTFNTTLTDIAEGQTRTVPIDIQGINPGTYNAKIIATSGELQTERAAPIDVISKEQARDENRKWYQVPGPGAAPAVLALLALAVFARRRP